MNKIIVLVGASASGKTTVGNILEKERGVNPLVSYTNRPIRKDEVDGVDYYFVDSETAKNSTIIAVEDTVYDGHYYGLWKTEVDRKLSTGKDVYAICDKHGASEIKRQYPDNTVVIWFKISVKNMYRRMRKRGDSFTSTVKRIYHAIRNDELKPPKYYDLIVDGNKTININDIIIKTKGEQ